MVHRIAKQICLTLVFSLLLTASIICLPAVPAQAAESGNLLVNGGGEKGRLTGWTDAGKEETGDGTFTVIDEYVWGGDTMVSCEGNYFFFAGATPGNRIYQDVDIAEYPVGTAFTLSGYMNGWQTGHGDYSYLEMDFLDGRGRSLARADVCEESIEGWELYSVSHKKPDGAAQLRVSLIAERHTGSDCDSYFDNIVLTAEVPEEMKPSSPEVSPAAPPESGIGERNVNDYEILWTNFNTDAVQNGAPVQVTLNVEDEVLICSITTYHWNKGKGAVPGSISIWENGDRIGTWEASARSGSGADNVLWDVFPDIILEAGHKYSFTDSSPATWSCNAASDHEGFLELRGIFTEDEESPADAVPVIGEANYELSYGEGDAPTSYINPVYISCDADKGELLISYTNEKDYFNELDPEDLTAYTDAQKTTLYRKKNGYWRKVSPIKTEITEVYHARTAAGGYGTIRLKFTSRNRDILFDDGEYAVRFDIKTGGHHMTPAGGDMFFISDAPEVEYERSAPADSADPVSSGAVPVSSEADPGSGQEEYTPAAYAVSGGTWFTLQSGERIYELADGSSTRNVWVRDNDRYYYIDYSGCLMKDGWSADGFWVAGDGSWMQSVPMRADDPEPLTEGRYGSDPYWTFDLRNYSDGSHYCIATKTYSFGSEETYDMTPLGHGSYLLEDMNDSGFCLQLSVSPDRNSIIVSGAGSTDDYIHQ